MRRLLALLAFAAALPGAASAQDYPTRPVVMVIPASAGGTFDVMGRILAVRMSELLGQQVVVENTAGAGGALAGSRVANAPPDGYMFMLGTIGTHAYNQTIYKKPRYDAANDFAPVTLFSEQPMTVSARKDLPVANFREFVAHLKTNATKLQYGSAGAGSTTHLACSLINVTVGVNVTHVAYRGTTPAATDLIGGRIDYMCNNLGSAMPLIKGDRVKALAILSRQRSALLPDLPTAHEQGLPGLDVVTWTAMFMPKGTPPDIVRKVGEATNAAMDTPSIKSKMREFGVEGVARERRSPDYLGKFVADEIARWTGPIKDAGLQID